MGKYKESDLILLSASGILLVGQSLERLKSPPCAELFVRVPMEKSSLHITQPPSLEIGHLDLSWSGTSLKQLMSVPLLRYDDPNDLSLFFQLWMKYKSFILEREMPNIWPVTLKQSEVKYLASVLPYPRETHYLYLYSTHEVIVDLTGQVSRKRSERGPLYKRSCL